MNWETIITILLLLGLAVASDKFEFVEKRTRKYQKVKEIYMTVVGTILIAVLLWNVISNWDKIDFFQGSGGNPQKSYEDQY